MRLVSTEKEVALLRPIIKNKEFGKKELEDQGKPVYHFRSMFADMSKMGSDLMVETYDFGF